jgi:hypothetical protein
VERGPQQARRGRDGRGRAGGGAGRGRLLDRRQRPGAGRGADLDQSADHGRPHDRGSDHHRGPVDHGHADHQGPDHHHQAQAEGPGPEGAAVKALQHRLHELGYQVQAADGHFGPETHHSVVAFQKVNRLGRDGVVGPITRRALERPRVPKPRSTKAGFHVEADLTLQVVYMVRDGKIVEILDASSASGQNYTVDGDVRLAVTPQGSFVIQRKIDAWRRSKLGLLYRPAYFIGGYALHGAYSVPPFPASHGCIRITITAMDRWYAKLPVGTPFSVYRS